MRRRVPCATRNWLVGQCGLRGRHPGYRDPERGATHIVQPRAVEEGDRLGVSPMLAADAQLQVLADGAPQPRAHAHQFANPREVDRLERAAVHDLLFLVALEEAAL